MSSNRPDELFRDPAIYESQYADAAQLTDIPFWIQLAKTLGPKVLELACGTGRITIPAFESGVDIDGLDFSEPMLKVARDRAKARSLPVNFFLGGHPLPVIDAAIRLHVPPNRHNLAFDQPI
jgi:SAM-dependent methyltransferase